MKILAILAAVLLLSGCYATIPANETPTERAARMQSSQMLFNAGMRILQMNQPRPAMPMQYRTTNCRQMGHVWSCSSF